MSMDQSRASQKDWDDWRMNPRAQKEIEERIRTLAASYVPEWNFDTENPDIGSVIGKIFAGQMAGNLERYHQVLDRYHTEFVNMLGISLLPAKPAVATVLLRLVQDTVSGVEVAKGTKLLAKTDSEDRRIVFETQHSLYVTNSSLEYVFMTGKKDGRMVPLKGTFRAPGLQEEEEEVVLPGLKKFRLFGKEEKGIGRNALLFYHTTVFDVEQDSIRLRILGGQKLIEDIKNGNCQILYGAEEGLIPVERLEPGKDSETLVIRKEKPCAKIECGESSYSLLAFVSKEPVKEERRVKGIWASSSGKPLPADSVSNNVTDFDVSAFEPFGDTLSLFQEFCIGSHEYFGKSGAIVKMTFDVSYKEHSILDNVQREDDQLKLIKRKPKTAGTGAAAESKAEEISLQYFNGIGWKNLVCMQDTKRMFADLKAGSHEISFLCPWDWKESGAGAYQGRCIRIQLLKADNCYLRPCVHYYPRIENLKLSYSYENHYVGPERLLCVAGTKKIDLTRRAREGKDFCFFYKSDYEMDALYLGFTKKPEGGPVSILFQMEEGVRFAGAECRFEYSAFSGFRQMKVLDYTMNMSRSGTVMFMPQPDMQAVALEGKKAFWIRLCRMDTEESPKNEELPVIKDICLNAVLAANVETREEEDFYLEEAVPNMTVNLGIPHILDLDLWVNEQGRLPKMQMQTLLKESPEMVRAEYDMLGNFSSFYVKWQEADQLNTPPSKRCYLLDRMNSQIIFGDGVSTELPRVLDDVAFKAVIRCCNGTDGNVEPGQINEAMSNLMFVEEIGNPVKAYGGSSMESLDSALRRGANILKSRKRLVSEDDYIQEILGFSDTIDKVKCVTGETIQGERRDSAVTFVILLKDFAAGSYSFHNVAGALKQHLMESCELTLAPEELHFTEPIFAKVSVDMWVEAPCMDDSFEIHHLLSQFLEQYLNPVSDGRKDGWEIGAMPKSTQILMKLNALKSRAVIKKMAATVSYTDQNGSHEKALDDIEENPFMICQSGRHRIHLIGPGLR